MVKLKEGYVMSAAEQVAYDRDNARPRKSWGQVAYYFKLQTKYPPRIYVFMHAEIWCDRNRRPMGLFHALPFLTRPMNREEIEYHHFDTRLCYHQYEAWAPLLSAEEREAQLLDMEQPGSGTMFLRALYSFTPSYRLKDEIRQGVPPEIARHLPYRLTIDLGCTEMEVLLILVSLGYTLPVQQISALLRAERADGNRKAVLLALQWLYRTSGESQSSTRSQSVLAVLRRAVQVQARTRRNFVRRIWKQSPLFALSEIQVRYPGYTAAQLEADVKRNKQATQFSRSKPVMDLRRCQLVKLAEQLNSGCLPEEAYHRVCCRIALLQSAHQQRLPVRLSVKLEQESRVYGFAWQIRETVVKSFVKLANTPGMTHDRLQAEHTRMTSSLYCF
ncbi:hypothetical protein HH214_08890 [Mucilaginibacter robiniae]|uniref:Uncharacterized protein n=1 Tax=Mucilaginibacter robiniae TaxID=2728022 RepID=A0A7L5DY98_9SPHI|nr:hypothetical protein [Mucilaginibacter robiniae]QJD95985.1 hypothetical protein HH214_08890 [Mucilaginibacter robiniae]